MKKWIPVAILVLLWGVICLKTYASGTYLLGWDNLAPELGFGINIPRALSTAWQEYQGVGLLGGMGHAADLTRQIILWAASFVVPTSVLRWGWTLLMLLIGSLGVYELGILFFSSGLVAIVGAIFYLLNPVTVQVFNVPFETFTSFYGFVPWMTWGALIYLREGKRVDLIKLLGILLLGMSAFVVQTLFVVFVIMLGIMSLDYMIRYRDINRVFKLWGVVVGANLFWLLPVLWFGITSSSVNVNAKMNLLATEEVELMNVAYGSLTETAKLNGWWLQNTDVGEEGQMILLMNNWTEWLGNKAVGTLGLVVFALTVIGLLAMFRKDQKRILKWSWILLLLFILIMLARRVDIFLKIYDYISQSIPLFGQMFRASYSKWSIPLILVMSVGVMSFIGMFNKRLKIIGWLIGVVILGMTTYTVLPAFKIGIVGERMKVNLPSEYLNLFNYFRIAEMSRIAKLPANSIWGWNYNGWGYRGSGFLWYGIEQPILDRAFDVWSPYNEGFYNEFSTTLYGGASDRVQQVLAKYDVRYVLLDESVIAPGQDKEILRIEETKRIAEELGWEQKFKEGFLTVWETTPTALRSGGQAGLVSAPEAYTLAEGETVKTREDVIFADNGSYVSGMGGVRYPFANLMREEVKNVEWGEEGVVTLRYNLVGSDKDLQPTRSDLGEQELIIPEWEIGEIVRVDYKNDGAIPAYFVNGEPGPRFLGKEVPKEGESHIFAKVSDGEEWEEYRQEQKFEIKSDELEIEVRGEPFVYDFATQGQGSTGNCDVLKRGVATKTGSAYYADSRGAVCDYVVMELPFTRLPYLLRLRGENYEGRSIKFFLYNTGSKRNDIEYLLDKGKFDQTFSLLPWNWDGYYTLNIETRSFGQRAENKIDPVVGMYVPLDKIAKAKIVNEQNSDLPVINNANVKYVKKTGTWLYGLGVEGEGLIRLSQGYDEGWVAWEIGNSKSEIRKLLHVKVDGWANGWLVSNQETVDSGQSRESNIVIIFYWPQLLQYLGFALLGATVLVLMLPMRVRV